MRAFRFFYSTVFTITASFLDLFYRYVNLIEDISSLVGIILVLMLLSGV